jgi:hypothetical protein
VLGSILVRARCPDIGAVDSEARAQFHADENLPKKPGKDLFNHTREVIDEPADRPP